MSDRAIYIMIASAEILVIGFLLGLVIALIFGGGIYALATGFIIWTLILGFTRALNAFFIIVPENSGAVIINLFRTYEENPKPTELVETKSLREVGPNLQGILLWERVGWVIDLGKQIMLDKPITTPSKDNIRLTISWQVMLTPLQGHLVNLVRHDEDTVTKYFDGYFRGKLIDFISHELAQSIAAKRGKKATKSVYERQEEIKDEFEKCLGGAGDTSEEEERFGTFTNNPQLLSITRSDDFQKSVEALAINENNARAIKILVKQGLSEKQALMAVLASQEKRTDGLIDATVSVTGLDNLQTLVMGPGLGINKPSTK